MRRRIYDQDLPTASNPARQKMDIHAIVVIESAISNREKLNSHGPQLTPSASGPKLQEPPYIIYEPCETIESSDWKNASMIGSANGPAATPP